MMTKLLLLISCLSFAALLPSSALSAANPFELARRLLPASLEKLGEMTPAELAIAGSVERGAFRIRPILSPSQRVSHSIQEIETVLAHMSHGGLFVGVRVQVLNASDQARNQSILGALVDFLDRGLRAAGETRRLIVRRPEGSAQAGDTALTAQRQASPNHYLTVPQRGSNDLAPRTMVDSGLLMESRVGFLDLGSRTYASVNLTGLSESEVTFVYRVLSDALDLLVHEGERALLR